MSQIGSSILCHKFQAMSRKSKGMIALYSSNYGSMPVPCLLLILLFFFFEGGPGAPLMGEEGMTLLCSFKHSVCKRETAYQGMYFCQSCENVVVFSSRILIMNVLSPKNLKIHKNFSWMCRKTFSCWCLGKLVPLNWEIAQWEQSQWETYAVTALLQPVEVCILLSMIKCYVVNFPPPFYIFFGAVETYLWITWFICAIFY